MANNQQQPSMAEHGGQEGFDIDLGNFDLSDFMHSSSTDGLYNTAANAGGGVDGGSMDIHYQNMQIQGQHLAYGNRRDSHSTPGGSSMAMFPRGGQAAVTADSLKLQLQQQMKLQQLQQLQNHILQQQIELISGQNQPHREMIMHGLLTPTSSSEIRPVVNHDFLSPMTLQGTQYLPEPVAPAYSPSLTPQSTTYNPRHHHASASLGTPMDVFSPLTSPALQPTIGIPAYGQAQWPSSLSMADPRVAPPPTPQQSASNKRPIEEDPSDSSRKRHSPIIKPTNPQPARKSNRSRPSMPPPPAPSSSSSSPSPNIEPVTPASIMNLGHSARMPTGLVPAGPMTPQQLVLAEQLGGEKEVGREKRDRAVKPKPPVTVPKPAKPSPVMRPSTSGSVPTTPKAILPNGMPTAKVPSISSNPSASRPASPQEPKKTSHKAAEQKRRDSLKAGFDDLRLLLPPIIIDPDSDEPLLPGSAPPRGPQRNSNLPPGSEDHPNRGVSKLALLRCGNEFIGRLNKRVERRDMEIEALRDEIRFLREQFGSVTLDESRVWVDLEKDLDECERDEVDLGVTAVGGKPRTDDGDGETGRRPRIRKTRDIDSGLNTVDEDDE